MKYEIIVLAIAGALVAGVAIGGELVPGGTLSKENWELAKDLLPPEILRHYQSGDYSSAIVQWNKGHQQWSQAFRAATERNAETLALDPKGSIVEKATGKRPAYVVGFPFPNVTADDPQAAIKILWNYFFYSWNNGNTHIVAEVNWVSPSGLDQVVTQNVYFLYYQGQPREFIPAENPDDLLMRFVALTEKPADLYGTNALSWRYRDPETRDAVWAYVPALRRARQVSPNNRSDGFLGSDLSQDDGPFFDGKPEDFTWKVVGEQDVLRLVDPYSLAGEFKRVEVPDGGWRDVYKRVPIVGFQDSKWKGSAWAPLNYALARRPCWIIEGAPKDSYYLFGKIQLYVDKETYHGAYNRKFDWKGELLNSYSVSAALNGRLADRDDYYDAGLLVGYQTAENVKLNRATVSTLDIDRDDPPSDRRIQLDPQFFTLQTLGRLGK